MNRDEVKSYILNHSRDYFQRDRSKQGFICPVCGSGSGKNGTGISTKDGVHYTCWAGCFTNADVFEIIGKERGLNSFNEQLQEAYKAFNIYPENEVRTNRKQNNTAMNTSSKPTENREKTEKQKPITDFKDFFLEAHSHITETDYPQQRGLSEKTIERFKLGYVESWKNPQREWNKTEPATPRLIIPITKYSYTARATRAFTADELRVQERLKPKEKASGKEHASWIFNYKALEQSQQPIFILEGEINAMSVIEAGGEAVAIGSTAYYRAFLEHLRGKTLTQPLLLAFDNDKAGKECTEKIVKGLEELEIKYLITDIANGFNDVNEALLADRTALQAKVKEAIEQAQQIKDEETQAEAERLLGESALNSLQGFRERYKSGVRPTIIPTGFSKLDEILNGGFRAGLYVMGAVSSLGKTSFNIQLADNIAKQSKPVLFVSLEMARDELVAKCLSRITYERSQQKYKSFNTAKTTIGILNTDKYYTYEPDSRAIIDESITELEGRANNLIILEGIGNIGVSEIKERAEAIKAVRGEAPIVFIDYLQILAPEQGFKGTDKQATDKAVLELKRMSRDLNTPVICISSFNRDSYREPVNNTSFKESGAIEYTSDVLLGLQYAGMDYGEKEAEGNTKRRDRVDEIIKTALHNGSIGKAQQLELKVLKNRNGKRGKVNIDFVPMFNYFLQAERDEEDEYIPLPEDRVTI